MLFNFELSTNNSYKALGRLIKFYRAREGYSLRDLGELTKVSHTLIANIELGKVKGSDNTISDILKTLNIHFYSHEEILEEFTETYNRAFDYLFKFEYSRANNEMEKLLEKENMYMHSVLITDYALIKFLHLVLLGKKPKDQYVDISVIEKTSGNLSASQQQNYFLIRGVNYYNMGDYKNAIDFLKKGLKVGLTNLDYLINVFLVKCYVKTYQFMSVVKVGNSIIDFFEEKIIYLRAMEVRLSISYSLMINKQYKEAKELLDSVYHFASNFNAIYLIDEVKLYLGSLAILEGNLEEAKRLVYSLNMDSPIVYFLKIRIAFRENNFEEIKKAYESFKKMSNHVLLKEEYILDITVAEIGLLELSEEEYISKINKTIKIGEEMCDVEVLNSSYNFLVRYYTKKRMYKKALDASTKARQIMLTGCLN